MNRIHRISEVVTVCALAVVVFSYSPLTVALFTGAAFAEVLVFALPTRITNKDDTK